MKQIELSDNSVYFEIVLRQEIISWQKIQGISRDDYHFCKWTKLLRINKICRERWRLSEKKTNDG